MKNTDELIQSVLTDVSTQIPALINTLNKNIDSKNKEIGSILEIAKSLKSAMESFASSVDQIKNLSEFIEISKETNVRLEEIRKEIENMVSITTGLNDKINKTKEKLNVKNPNDIVKEALGEKRIEMKKSGNSLLQVFGLLFVSSLLSSILIIGAIKYIL